MSVSHGYAQTNLQLYAQLRHAGYSLSDLNQIQLAYEFACELFTCQHRPSGKSFLSHLIGTASILGSLHVSKDIIAAGLLHAAYKQGDFGDGRPGISSGKRNHVRQRMGHDTEQYIAKYDAFKWNDQTIPVVHQHFATMEMIDRDILLMRLVNELEDLLDDGIVLLPNVQDRIQRFQQWRQAHIELPTFLGYPTLSSELSRAIEETLEELGSHSAPVQNSISRIWSFTILPLSHHYRLLISLRRTIAQSSGQPARHWAKNTRHPTVAKVMASPMIRFLKKRILFMSKA